MSSRAGSSSLASMPSVDRLLRDGRAVELALRHGREPLTQALRDSLGEARQARLAGREDVAWDEASIVARAGELLERASASPLRPVFNLTGTVLHTNLGRALLPVEAVEAMCLVAVSPSNLEYALEEGKRGDRDEHLEAEICRLTGAQAATVVNNNAAAVLLALNSLALGREVPTSRGELVEIGGAFRMPDVMRSSGCILREVGTTNRTHLRDFEEAIGAATGAVMKVHTSNYEVVGFTSAVDEAELGALCARRGVPFVVDLGSGSLVDLRHYGLPPEPTPAQAIANGADLVTFSGDKLLGGPQAGIIAGRADLVEQIKRNPMKRAMRVDKLRIAALSAVLRLYRDPERLPAKLPTLRALARPLDEIAALAKRLQPAVAEALGAHATVSVDSCESQVGSGALPSRRLPSAALAIAPPPRSSGRALIALEQALRALPVPVIGRIHSEHLWLDLRCLEDEAGFRAQLPRLRALLDAT